eukprot:Clim_evm2s237 gene=Clim_evmTU2s237
MSMTPLRRLVGVGTAWWGMPKQQYTNAVPAASSGMSFIDDLRVRFGSKTQQIPPHPMAEAVVEELQRSRPAWLAQNRSQGQPIFDALTGDLNMEICTKGFRPRPQGVRESIRLVTYYDNSSRNHWLAVRARGQESRYNLMNSVSPAWNADYIKESASIVEGLVQDLDQKLTK